MWFHIKIFAQVLAVIFLPFLLTAGLIRIFLPRAKAWRVAMLGVAIILFLDSYLHCFSNPVSIDRIVTQALDTSPLQEFGATAEWFFIALSFAAMLFGSILIPLLFARGGVAIVDKLKKRR